MTRFIRWQGLSVFLLLSALITSFLYFFAENLVKAAIVNSAESTFGAEVNIVAVKLGYSPLQISIVDLQVTDKEKPTQNLFSFGRAVAGIDVWQYLFGKIIIDELDVSQLAFSSVRTYPGKVYLDDNIAETRDESLSDQAKALLPEVDMKLPDVKALLNDSNLLTVKATTQLQESYAAEQLKIKALKTQLPNKAKLKYYQDKVAALGKMKVSSLTDIEKIKIQFAQIKKEFKSDQALVKKAKKQIVNSKNLLAKQISQLKEAPAKDWQQIEQNYQLESIDMGDFAHILFGEQAREYLQKTQWFYDKVSPLMTNIKSDNPVSEEKLHAKGRFINFAEESPLPDILIKKALFSIKLTRGDVIVKGSELTHQHWIRGKESPISIHSTTNGEFIFNGQFKREKSGEFIAGGAWFVNDRQLANVELTKSKALTLSLMAANLNGKGQFTIINNEVVANNHFSLNQASYQGQANSTMTKLLLETVKSLDNLTIDIGVSGELSKPSISITSSLNDALAGAFKQQVAGKINDFKQKVTQGLNEKLAKALKIGDSQTAELLNVETLLTDTDKALTDLKNSDIVKQQQKKLEDKVKNKLKDKLSDLFG